MTKADHELEMVANDLHTACLLAQYILNKLSKKGGGYSNELKLLRVAIENYSNLVRSRIQ